MGFFKKLFSPQPNKPADFSYWITVKCNRCGEKIRSRIDLRNDLSLDYDKEVGPGATYYCRKTLIGSERCFQPIDIDLTFNASRKLVNRQITGGEFVDE
jgi:hypothetical protein